MLKILLPAAVFAIGAGPAAGQAVSAYKGELVLNAKGEPVAPWRELRICEDENRKAIPCRVLIVKGATDEIAIMDGQMATQFERTGNGQEVQRAESANAKAARLKGGQPKP
jgi:hypothetical protein